MRRKTARNKAEQTAEQRHREAGEGDAERDDAASQSRTDQPKVRLRRRMVLKLSKN